MQICVRHYTVGRDSTAIGDRGYFHWLIARDGAVTQFAETDAVTWHAGEWNGMGPGIENEYLDEDQIMSLEQIVSARGLVAWLHSEWGIPLDEYRGPRIPSSTDFSGFLDHTSLIQTEEHYDYWPEDAWLRIVGTPPTPPQKRKRRMNWIAPGPDPAKPMNWYRECWRSYMGDQGTIDFLVKTLKDAGESVYYAPDAPVSEDFHESFTLVGPDYNPPRH